MKKLVLFVLLSYSCLLLFGMNSRNQIDNENFFDFFKEFNNDKNFQLSRINFPFISSYISSDDDEIVIDTIWNSSSWNYIFLMDTCNGFFNAFYSKDLNDLIEQDTIVLESFLTNTSISRKCFFQK